MCSLDDFNNLVLDPEHRAILEGELEWWHEAYLPSESIEGKCVLKVRAGNGETALFYLLHGAAHVVCIEPKADLLYKDFGQDTRITIIPRAIDFIESDCEGGKRNAVIETHFPFKLEEIRASRMLDRTTVCWRLKEMPRLEGLMSRIPRHVPFVNLHLARAQAVHSSKRTLRGRF